MARATLDTSLEAALAAARQCGIGREDVQRRMDADRVTYMHGEKRDAYMRGLTAAFLTVATHHARLRSPGGPRARSPPTSMSSSSALRSYPPSSYTPRSHPSVPATPVSGSGGSARGTMNTTSPPTKASSPPLHPGVQDDASSSSSPRAPSSATMNHHDAVARALSALPPGVQMAALLEAAGAKPRSSPSPPPPATSSPNLSPPALPRQHGPHDIERALRVAGEAFALRKEPMTRPPRLPDPSLLLSLLSLAFTESSAAPLDAAERFEPSRWLLLVAYESCHGPECALQTICDLTLRDLVPEMREREVVALFWRLVGCDPDRVHHRLQGLGYSAADLYAEAQLTYRRTRGADAREPSANLRRWLLAMPDRLEALDLTRGLPRSWSGGGRHSPQWMRSMGVAGWQQDEGDVEWEGERAELHEPGVDEAGGRGGGLAGRIARALNV